VKNNAKTISETTEYVGVNEKTSVLSGNELYIYRHPLMICLSACYSKQLDVVFYDSFDIPSALYQAVGSRRATGAKPEQSLECGHR